MLDIARVIVEKSPDNPLLKVKIFSALGEVSLERGSLKLYFFMLLQTGDEMIFIFWPMVYFFRGDRHFTQ